MNFSREHKLVFILDKFCGEKNITQVLQDFGFQFLKNQQESPLTRDNFSFGGLIPRAYDDFFIVRLVDNPYYHFIYEFMGLTEENWILKEFSKEYFSQRFNKWLELYFENWDEIYFEDIWRNSQYKTFVCESKSNKIPHFYIKKDNIAEDLKKIELFKNVDIEINEIFFPKTRFDLKNIYTYANAKKIFKLNRNFFLELDYDPFSFTTDELTKKEKVDFIHN